MLRGTATIFPSVGKSLLVRSSLSRFRRSAPRRTSRSSHAPARYGLRKEFGEKGRAECAASKPKGGCVKFAFVIHPTSLEDVIRYEPGAVGKGRPLIEKIMEWMP